MRQLKWEAGLLAALALAVTQPAAGQDDEAEAEDKPGAADADAPEPKAGASMEGGDPADTEKAERGRFSPQGKTGKLADAEKDEKDEKKAFVRKERKRLNLFGEFLIGMGQAPTLFPNEPLTNDATSFTFMAGGGFDLTSKLTLGLRFAWSTASVEFGGSESQTAFASPELFGEYRHELSKRTSLPIGLGIAIPVGQGEPDPTTTDTGGQAQYQVNTFVDAAYGWQEGELFLPKRLPITPSVGIIHYLTAELELHGWTKLIVSPKTGPDIENPTQVDQGVETTYSMNAVALRSVTLAGLGFDFLEKPRLMAGLDAWMVISAIDPVEFETDSGASDPSPFQFVLEPRIAATFGPITPSIGYIIPLGGELREMSGLRLRADLAF